MKKIFKIFILSFLILVLTKDTYAKEKTVETNINFTHLNVNEEDGIKVTNSKKVTAKLSKNIAKISVKGNKITIKAKKVGITDLTIKSSGSINHMKSPLASFSPVFRAALNPPFSLSTILIFLCFFFVLSFET